MMPTIIGISSSPDSVGVAPFTSCRYSGSVLSAPNMPRPISTFTLSPMLNTRLLNSRIGISASSFIRLSIRMKAMTPMMPSAIRPRTAGGSPAPDPALLGDDQQRHDADHQRGGAPPVDPVVGAGCAGGAASSRRRPAR